MITITKALDIESYFERQVDYQASEHLWITSYFTECVEECGNDQQVLFGVVDEILGRKKEMILHGHTSLNDALNSFSLSFHTKVISIRQNLDIEDPSWVAYKGVDGHPRDGFI